MYYRFLLLGCLLFGVYLSARAQSRQEDSLRQVAYGAPHDTTRAYAWYLLSVYAESNDSTIRCAERALRLIDRFAPAMAGRPPEARWQTIRASS